VATVDAVSSALVKTEPVEFHVVVREECDDAIPATEAVPGIQPVGVPQTEPADALVDDRVAPQAGVDADILFFACIIELMAKFLSPAA